jgi:hypothetical protein
MKRDGLPRVSLDAPGLRADPLADAAIARILGERSGDAGPDLDAIALVNGQLARWQRNGELAGWRAGAGVPPEVAGALEDYVAAAGRLPDWADPDRIARAERVFMDMSMLSCTLLFCASLPQCYVMPDLAAVLQVAGQLEQHTDYRIRSTAAMIFPVMMRGGLTDADGGGVAQAVKVRLIHATIRHLILRGAPQQALAGGPVPPLAPRGPGLQQALYAHGWDSAQRGLPCNQEELAYTLLTFSYVFLMGLRRLGLGLPRADEEAYLHAWNVLGHLLGIERALMADTMDAAQALFEDIQARARPRAGTPDPRPALASALIGTMRRYIPLALLKPFPVLLTRHLCGKAASKDLGLDGHVSWLSRALFALGMGAVRAIDATVRLFLPGFSISRLLGRILGYRLTVRLLMDQTRPLKLPAALLGEVGGVVRGWRDDPKAPRWMNALERHFTKG